jgi:hypothetical protein
MRSPCGPEPSLSVSGMGNQDATLEPTALSNGLCDLSRLSPLGALVYVADETSPMQRETITVSIVGKGSSTRRLATAPVRTGAHSEARPSGI